MMPWTFLANSCAFPENQASIRLPFTEVFFCSRWLGRSENGSGRDLVEDWFQCWSSGVEDAL